MEQLLRDVQQRILATVPLIKYVDEDWGQLDYYSPNMPVQMPALLIDASTAQWSNVGELGQIGLVTVRLQLATMRHSNTSGQAPAQQRDNAFAVYGLLNALHKALHGWAGNDTYTHLIRTSNRRLKREDGLVLYEILYTVSLTDYSTVVLPQLVSPSPRVQIALRPL